MQRRAGLARAMALDPDILFFDEPSAGLDPISSRLLGDLILELRANLGAIDRCGHRFGRTRESPTRIRQSVWVATPSRDPTRSALARQRSALRWAYGTETADG